MRDTRRTRLLLALLLTVSVTLITLDSRGGGGPVAAVRGAATALFGPAERLAAVIVHPVADAVQNARHLGDYRQRISALERENAALQVQLRTSEAARRRAAELDRLLRVTALGQYHLVPARVVAVGRALGFEWTATIDAGSRDGVRPEMTLLNGDGLVGRIKTVGPTSATVLLLPDRIAAVAARLEGSGELGVVSGRGRDALEFTLLDPQAAVRVSERLVTAGSPNNVPFVPGVPIGTVTSVEPTRSGLTRVAQLRPFVRFTALDLVGVVVAAPRTGPRQALLPPASARG
ncbi:MAG TPA: rod shape-determining protein MreC [Mycobacteriales bacterium]|nr:rod shape-determining protein MreC [Mycobacteriales bacterium]